MPSYLKDPDNREVALLRQLTRRYKHQKMLFHHRINNSKGLHVPQVELVLRVQLSRMKQKIDFQLRSDLIIQLL